MAMTDDLKTKYKQADPPHPGKVIIELYLMPQGMSVESASELFSMPELQWICGKGTPVTAKTAIKLSEVFGGDPTYWMNLQANYDLWKERRKSF